MQAILQTAIAHGANPDKPLPINTAYICWQLARQEQLAGLLSMLAGVLGMPSLPSAFMTALTQLGKESAAATLSDLAQVRHRHVSEAAAMTSAMTSITFGLLVPLAVVAAVVVVVIAGVTVVIGVDVVVNSTLIALQCLLRQDSVMRAHCLSSCP